MHRLNELHGYDQMYSRGPKLGTADGDINPTLLDAYNFETTNNQAFIERDNHGKITRIQLNSADNYARYNLVCLLERARKQNIHSPIDRIILGCTHYPFAIETLKKHLIELKAFQDKGGRRPYAHLIADDCDFIDPAIGTAYECYKTLLADKNLNDIGNQGTLEPYISVASALLPSECLDKDGNLTYTFKYGRDPGSEDITTMFVPFSERTVSAYNLLRIKRLLPMCAEKISDFMDRNAKNEQVAVHTEKTPFTPWTLFVDAGIIAILLLIGKLIRVKIKWVQQLFIPPSLIAGFIGLSLGPNGFHCIPLSENTGTYAGILIACIFGCLPFASGSSKATGSNIGRMWVYSQIGMLAQWILGGIMGILILRLFWPELNSAFGLAMPSGYCGGHGTAAALGAAFQTYNYDDMLTLAMTAATIGIIGSVIIGLLIVKRGTQKGYTSFLSNFSDLPREYRTGLLPEEKRTKLGTTTTSSISMDSLTFNFAIVMSVALGGYGLSKLVQLFVPELSLPVFSCAFIVGIIVATIFKKVGIAKYVCTSTVGHLSGTFTDILVACGIASIKLSVVVQNFIPLLILPGVELRPLLRGGSGVQSHDRHQPMQYPTRLEAGTLNSHGIAGLGAAVDYLSRQGVEALYRREHALTTQFYEGVSAIEGVTVYGDFSQAPRAAIVSLNVRDCDSSTVADALYTDYEIAVRAGAHCAPRMHAALGTTDQGAVRFSFSPFNTEKEIQTAVEAVRQIAQE